MTIDTGNYSVVASRHDIHRSLIGKWVRQYRKNGVLGQKIGAVQVVTIDSEFRRLSSEMGALREENERLKKLLSGKGRRERDSPSSEKKFTPTD